MSYYLVLFVAVKQRHIKIAVAHIHVVNLKHVDIANI